MKTFIPKKPKQKYIIPKERPTSFLLNQEEKNEILYKINDAELLNSNYVPNKCQNLFIANNYYLGIEDNSEKFENFNTILKVLKLLKSRSLSKYSYDTKNSDNN